jgi:radical SAM-linked protein
MTDPSPVTDSAAPNPQPVIVQKLRVRYAKRGRLRFASHRDFGRAFERALRRAGIPIGHSSGYTPHPKISYANAAPTGAGSEAEYLEIGLIRTLDPVEVRQRLDAALPDGLDIVEVVAAGPGSLADRLEASEWAIDLPEVDPTALATAVAAFESAAVVTTERMTKRGMRTIDVRTSVVSLAARGTTLSAVIRAAIPTVRPEDIVTGLQRYGLSEFGTPVAVRLAQGPLSGTAVGDPLEPDRQPSAGA